MAGDWIPFRTALVTSPKVSRICHGARVTRCHALGALASMWCWAQAHTATGLVRGISVAQVAELAGIDPPTMAGIEAVGLIVTEGDGVRFPEWDKYLSRGAKARLEAADRQRRSRERNKKPRHASVTKMSQKNVTTEQNRTEDIEVPKGTSNTRAKTAFDASSIALPTSLDTPAFRSAWAEFVAHRVELRSRLTERAAAKQLAKMAQYGPAASAAAIERAIASGWRSVFPENEGTRNGSHVKRTAPAEASAYTGGDAPAWD